MALKALGIDPGTRRLGWAVIVHPSSASQMGSHLSAREGSSTRHVDSSQTTDLRKVDRPAADAAAYRGRSLQADLCGHPLQRREGTAEGVPGPCIPTGRGCAELVDMYASVHEDRSVLIGQTVSETPSPSHLPGSAFQRQTAGMLAPHDRDLTGIAGECLPPDNRGSRQKTGLGIERASHSGGIHSDWEGAPPQVWIDQEGKGLGSDLADLGWTGREETIHSSWGSTLGEQKPSEAIVRPQEWCHGGQGRSLGGGDVQGFLCGQRGRDRPSGSCAAAYSVDPICQRRHELRHAGSGFARRSPVLSDHGCIAPDSRDSLSRRLAFLSHHLSDLVRAQRPDVLVLERVFVARNPASALALGYSRGLCLALAGVYDIPVIELTASSVKASIAGHGRATKAQMIAMMHRLFHVQLQSDVADAAALALCAGSRWMG